ncbi:MAG: hypothetical protein MJ245_05015 [Clostridia bacterium]|nr:hypothetical protein [Clostridia bacterium]
MKKLLLIILTLCLSLNLFGCKNIYPELNDDAKEYKFGSLTYGDDEEGYVTVEYNGRTYIPYGVLSGTIHENDIKECIGYVFNEEFPEDNDTRLFTLVSDPDENFLMIHYVANSFMNPPSFLRAVDTKDIEIDIPSFILSLDYDEYWNN